MSKKYQLCAFEILVAVFLMSEITDLHSEDCCTVRLASVSSSVCTSCGFRFCPRFKAGDCKFPGPPSSFISKNPKKSLTFIGILSFTKRLYFVSIGDCFLIAAFEADVLSSFSVLRLS